MAAAWCAVVTPRAVLVGNSCCGRTRAEALRPLLANPSLKVFSTLVMDAATAKELLE